MANNKTYILIDYYNEIYGFVNSPNDLNAFYASQDPAINISTLPRNQDGILTDAILVNLKTKVESHILFSTGSTLCITNNLL